MKIAILGATGAVGQEIITCLDDLHITFDELRFLTSKRSAGKTMKTPWGDLVTEEVTEKSFVGIDYAIFSAGGSVSMQWAPVANKCGCVVIDNSSAFRYDDEIPLIVPEINGEKAKGSLLIANPNCTTIITDMVVYPLYKKFGIKQLLASSYQSASGAGARGMQELLDETGNALKNRPVSHREFAHPIAFNVIPHIDVFQENGYTKEEMKMAWETRKIFGDEHIDISCTCVRIPVLRAHCITVVLETKEKCSPEEARALLQTAPGVEVVDDREQNKYPLPITASKKHNVEVGRIRQNLVFGDHGLELFIAGDQLLKGAALNAVQILQILLSK